MKRRHVKLDGIVSNGRLCSGVARIIRKRPNNLPPYVDIEDTTGNIVVSLNDREMDQLCKKWMAL